MWVKHPAVVLQVTALRGFTSILNCAIVGRIKSAASSVLDLLRLSSVAADQPRRTQRLGRDVAEGPGAVSLTRRLGHHAYAALSLTLPLVDSCFSA